MAQFTVKGQYKNVYGTAANFTSNNPILNAGVIAIESDTDKMKVGDGTTTWVSLAYSFEPSNGADWTIAAATGSNYAITSTANKFFLKFTRDTTARTITLPDPTDADHIGQTIKIQILGTGSGNVTLQGPSSENINLTDGVTSVTSMTWDGAGQIEIVPNGTDYDLVSTGVWDSFSTGTTRGNGLIQKNSNGRRYYNGWDFVQGSASSVTVVTRALPITLNNIIEVSGECFGYKDSSDPTSRTDKAVGDIGVQFCIVNQKSTTQIGLAVCRADGVATGSSSRYMANVRTIDEWAV